MIYRAFHTHSLMLIIYFQVVCFNFIHIVHTPLFSCRFLCFMISCAFVVCVLPYTIFGNMIITSALEASFNVEIFKHPTLSPSNVYFLSSYHSYMGYFIHFEYYRAFFSSYSFPCSFSLFFFNYLLYYSYVESFLFLINFILL